MGWVAVSYMCRRDGHRWAVKDQKRDGGGGGWTYLSLWGVRNFNKYLAQACQNGRGGGMRSYPQEDDIIGWKCGSNKSMWGAFK